MQPQDNLPFLNTIDNEIGTKNIEKRDIQIEITKLNSKLETLDSQLLFLLKQKRILGKAQYANPIIRKELIQAGSASEDISIRVAAYQMEQLGLSKEKYDDFTDEIIDYMILLDNNFRIVNKNSIDPSMLLNKRQEKNEIEDGKNDN